MEQIMQMCLEFLRLLESIRFPALDGFMVTITELGGEAAFLAIAIIMFWCVDKLQGYYILSVGFVGTLTNQFLKILLRVPRPWVLDPTLKPLEQSIPEATGFSFPSGHTQSAVGNFGGIALVTKNKIVKAVCLFLAIVVPFSRMYVGVHTPLDVIVSVVIAVALLFILRPLIFKHDGKLIPYILLIMTAFNIAYMLYVMLFPFPADIDPERLESARESAFTLLGALSGFFVVYFVDKKWLHFPVKAVWWAQIIKCVVGLVLVLAVKSGLSAPLAALLTEYPGRTVRYFLVAIVAGIVWPMTFKWFAKLGKKAGDE